MKHIEQKNLDQLRACHALERGSKLDRAAVNRLPALILANGLLATVAFCADPGATGVRTQMAEALKSLADYLKQRGLLNLSSKSDKEVLSNMLQELCEKSSHDLQRITTEALAYLSYLKRFASK